MRTIGLIALIPLLLWGCGESPPQQKGATQTFPNKTSQSEPPRWYSDEQIAIGGPLFQANCAACHKPDASGTENWKQPDAAGKYPPPPLNGTAHTWHHALPVLRRTIRLGGERLGGTMPGFEGKLNEEEIDAILAWVQSHWPQEIYAIWHQRNGQ